MCRLLNWVFGGWKAGKMSSWINYFLIIFFRPPEKMCFSPSRCVNEPGRHVSEHEQPNHFFVLIFFFVRNFFFNVTSTAMRVSIDLISHNLRLNFFLLLRVLEPFFSDVFNDKVSMRSAGCVSGTRRSCKRNKRYVFLFCFCPNIFLQTRKYLGFQFIFYPFVDLEK